MSTTPLLAVRRDGADYDAGFTQRRIGRLMREAVWRHARRHVRRRPPGARSRLRDRRGRRASRAPRGPCRGDSTPRRRWWRSRARRSWPPVSATPSTCASPRSRPGFARYRRGPERHPGSMARSRTSAGSTASPTWTRSWRHSRRGPPGRLDLACRSWGRWVPWEWGWLLAHGPPGPRLPPAAAGRRDVARSTHPYPSVGRVVSAFAPHFHVRSRGACRARWCRLRTPNHGRPGIRVFSAPLARWEWRLRARAGCSRTSRTTSSSGRSGSTP